MKALQYENRKLLKSKPEKLQCLLELINANWENPLRGTYLFSISAHTKNFYFQIQIIFSISRKKIGISDLLIDILGNILDLLDDCDLNNELLEKTLMDLNWKLKSIYPPLIVLLPRIGKKKAIKTKNDSTCQIYWLFIWVCFSRIS